MMTTTVLITSLGEDMNMKNSLNSGLPMVENVSSNSIISYQNKKNTDYNDAHSECNGKLLQNGTNTCGNNVEIHMDKEGDQNSQLTTHKYSKLHQFRRKRYPEKIVYVASVGTVSLLTHGLVSAQYLIPYYYAISTPIFLLIRTIIYFFSKWQYFLLDFCYYGNMMCLVFIWGVPQQPQYFCVLFALTNGPILWSLVLFRNSLVFHSFDKTVSIFVHLMPSLVSFTVRWYPVKASKLWYTDFVPNFIDWSFVWLVGVPLGCFILHSVLYTILVMYILKPKEEYQTVYRLLTMKPDSFIFRSFNILGPKYRYWIYKMYYWGFCLLSVLFSILWYNFFIPHCIFIILVIVIATWNGACYYLEVFNVRDRREHLRKFNMEYMVQNPEPKVEEPEQEES